MFSDIIVGNYKLSPKKLNYIKVGNWYLHYSWRLIMLTLEGIHVHAIPIRLIQHLIIAG